MEKRNRRKPDVEIPRQQALPEEGHQRQSVESAPKDGAQSSAKAPNHHTIEERNQRFMNALGTTDSAFADGIFLQIARAIGNVGGDLDCEQLFFSQAVVTGVKPRGELVAMQIAQMT